MKSPEKPLEVARQLDPTLAATEDKTQMAQFISSMVQATVQATAQANAPLYKKQEKQLEIQLDLLMQLTKDAQEAAESNDLGVLCELH